jgi:hypothetical protein
LLMARGMSVWAGAVRTRPTGRVPGRAIAARTAAGSVVAILADIAVARIAAAPG